MRLGNSCEAFCPRCNRISSLEVRATAFGTAPTALFDQLADGEEGLRTATYSVAFCPKCSAVFLIASASSEPSELPHELVLFPSQERRSVAGVPESVRRTYHSAQRSYDTANYDACVVMSRKCLEAVCAHFELRDGSLATRLARLRDEHHLESRLYMWANELRLVGNEAVHDVEAEMSQQDALDALDLVEVILLYVFSLDRRFRDFYSRRHPL